MGRIELGQTFSVDIPKTPFRLRFTPVKENRYQTDLLSPNGQIYPIKEISQPVAIRILKDMILSEKNRRNS